MYSDDWHKVEITPAAQRRHIKKLEKRHKTHWAVTLIALKEEIKRIEAFLQTDKAEILHAIDGHRLVKIYFTIARSGQSAKASGHRCIVHIEGKTKTASILLVYSKQELSSPNETGKIRAQIKKNHPETAALFNLR